MEHEGLRRRLEEGDPLWPAQLAVATAIALNLGLSDRVTIGPVWLLPAIEGVLLVALVVMAPRRVSGEGAGPRRFALAVIGLVSVVNIVSLALLVRFLVIGGHAQGRPLIGSGALLWLTNVLLFAVWFWEMDRGGPVARHRGAHAMSDFQFPQMENPGLAPKDWEPQFVDYFYTSFTNAAAFSPTDVMPLSRWAKLAMLAQSALSLLIAALVVARAVNILK